MCAAAKRSLSTIPRDHKRPAVLKLELDPLVVPEAPEGRVDPAREHRGDQVEAHVDFLDAGGARRLPNDITNSKIRQP